MSKMNLFKPATFICQVESARNDAELLTPFKLDRHLNSLDLCVKVSNFDSMKTQLRLIFCPVTATILGAVSCGDFTKDGPDPLTFIGTSNNVTCDRRPSSVRIVEVRENVDGNQQHHDALVSLSTEEAPANFNQGPVDFIAPELNEFASENDGALLPPRSPRVLYSAPHAIPGLMLGCK